MSPAMLIAKPFPRLALVSALLLSAWTAQAANTTPHWEYKGKHNPEHWAHLDASFEGCSAGKRQSPIDIKAVEKVALPSLDFGYSPTKGAVVNNGHTIQVNLPAGNGLTVGDQRYELLQFHFHTPSEEALNGKRKPLVAHFVHRSATGQLGVVAVLFDFGKANAPYAPVFEHLPAKAGETITADDLTLDLAALLPAEKGYYSFEGSLTTPPCSEGVNWMVLKQPVKLSAQQVKRFRQMFSFNARPIQPLNGRVVKESL
jgi:carbonic anhydrase